MIVVVSVHFVIDSATKLLDTPSYTLPILDTGKTYLHE